MLNKLLCFLRQHQMVQAEDTVICAVSGGADSMALLFAMYLMREKLRIRLEAAHFNHGLRGLESDRDEAFVRQFCDRYEIPLHCERGVVEPGPKGLEAAAREARYRFLKSLNGKIATAHTADDNAETVLMHLVRGTGLKGLGGITPVRSKVIRPMLTVTRRDVLAFLEEYHVAYVTDSTNEEDAFLRNRLRHRVMPLLQQENPRLSENISAMALQLRQDEQALQTLAGEELPPVSQLRQLPGALQSRLIAAFLVRSGLKEPERSHIDRALSLVYSNNPSARAQFPGGVCICRDYDRLRLWQEAEAWQPVALPVPGCVEVNGWRITAAAAHSAKAQFTFCPQGTVYLRPRQPGDTMRLPGGTKSLKKLYIDRKIPAHLRPDLPVLVDDAGVIAVCGVGANLDRMTPEGAQITIERL